jgi:hypothetical protein
MKGFKMHCINVLGMWEKSQSADGRFLFILKITSAQWLCSNRQSPLVTHFSARPSWIDDCALPSTLLMFVR